MPALRSKDYPASYWRKERNGRVHRATRTVPVETLAEESLLPLPALPYRPVSALIGTTAFVEFETNRYSVPADCARTGATVLAYPDHLEIVVNERKVAYHRRSFPDHLKGGGDRHDARDNEPRSFSVGENIRLGDGTSAILDRLSMNGTFVTFEGRSHRNRNTQNTS